MGVDRDVILDTKCMFVSNNWTIPLSLVYFMVCFYSVVAMDETRTLRSVPVSGALKVYWLLEEVPM